MNRTKFWLGAVFWPALCLSTASAAKLPVQVGDPLHGARLYERECADCHGGGGTGGRTGVRLDGSGRMNLLPDETLRAMIEKGAGLKRPEEHRFAEKLSLLDAWDVVQHLRALHMPLQSFFPDASRFVAKVYTIDQHGLARIAEHTGNALKDTSAAVFTFFDFEGEQGNLRHVPQDPILLDQLKKDKKLGYLVFLPFKTTGFEGEVGVAMAVDGKILRLAVPARTKGADALNRNLAAFHGMGTKGQTDKFRVRGAGKDDLAAAVFPTYMRAMETVTMYDREERERTWAED